MVVVLKSVLNITVPDTIPITFTSESTPFDFDLEKKIVPIIELIISDHKKHIGQLDYIFCSDDYLLELNKKHLGHDYYTDIITFPYSEDPISSDVFISIDRVKENAKTYSVSFEQELFRVILHGVLHLVGIKDKTEEESKEMREKENYYLENLIR